MRTLTKTLALLLGACFAMPLWAQTCPEGIEQTKPTSQYQVNSDGTVKDTKTNLIWAQCSYGLEGEDCDTGSAQILTWQEALEVAQTANSAQYLGHSDWRLPNVKELQSLAEKACFEPAINAEVFPNTPLDVLVNELTGYYWSSSPNTSVNSQAWGVTLKNGYENRLDKDEGIYVRLVRASQ